MSRPDRPAKYGHFRTWEEYELREQYRNSKNVTERRAITRELRLREDPLHYQRCAQVADRPFGVLTTELQQTMRLFYGEQK
jgi:hypothetical protein